MVKRSKVCPPPQLSKLLRSKISKTVHPSAVQVPEEYTAILSRAISPGCTGTVNLTCHYLWVQLRAAAPLPNTAGSIYAAKWWDGTGKQSDRKKLRWIFFFFHILSQVSLSNQSPEPLCSITHKSRCQHKEEDGNTLQKRSEAQTPLLPTAHTSGAQSTVPKPAH